MTLHAQQYRQFLKAAYKATNYRYKDVIRDRIRRRFHDPPSTHVELKSKGMEHRIVRNICYYDALEKEPPHYNKKMSAAKRQIHDTAYDDLHLIIHMLNAELNVCL
ncbi:hypothetical protein BX666DRAFT_2029699 [Dichotomocladium elegans]|nr:hypothetical protein BX666DRAFT_2029699 [Dichotomocladium elegans]